MEQIVIYLRMVQKFTKYKFTNKYLVFDSIDGNKELSYLKNTMFLMELWVKLKK